MRLAWNQAVKWILDFSLQFLEPFLQPKWISLRLVVGPHIVRRISTQLRLTTFQLLRSQPPAHMAQWSGPHISLGGRPFPGQVGESMRLTRSQAVKWILDFSLQFLAQFLLP